MEESNPIIGLLKFHYFLKPYSYIKELAPGQNPNWIERREITDLLEYDTNNVIGTINIHTVTTLYNDEVFTHVYHDYYLNGPDNTVIGTLCANFITKSGSSQGVFLNNTVQKTNLGAGSSGNFLGAPGIISIRTDNTNEKHVEITFYKKWEYPFDSLV